MFCSTLCLHRFVYPCKESKKLHKWTTLETRTSPDRIIRVPAGSGCSFASEEQRRERAVSRPSSAHESLAATRTREEGKGNTHRSARLFWCAVGDEKQTKRKGSSFHFPIIFNRPSWPNSARSYRDEVLFFFFFFLCVCVEWIPFSVIYKQRQWEGGNSIYKQK